jgi:DNA-binding NarL/FixJ family response regulator
VAHILEKLGVQSRTQAVLAAMRLGLVPQNQEKM